MSSKRLAVSHSNQRTKKVRQSMSSKKPKHRHRVMSWKLWLAAMATVSISMRSIGSQSPQAKKLQMMEYLPFLLGKTRNSLKGSKERLIIRHSTHRRKDPTTKMLQQLLRGTYNTSMIILRCIISMSSKCCSKRTGKFSGRTAISICIRNQLLSQLTILRSAALPRTIYVHKSKSNQRIEPKTCTRSFK